MTERVRLSGKKALAAAGVLVAGGFIAGVLVESDSHQIGGTNIVDCASGPTTGELVVDLAAGQSIDISEKGFIKSRDLTLTSEGSGAVKATNRGNSIESELDINQNGSLGNGDFYLNPKHEIIFTSGSIQYTVDATPSKDSSTRLDIKAICVK